MLESGIRSAATGSLVKASLIIAKAVGKPDVFKVQFNPSEYTITRKVVIDEKTGNGQQAAATDKQVVKQEATVLDVSLYFDAYTDLKDVGIASTINTGIQMVKKPKKTLETFTAVNDLCNKVMNLVQYVSDQHKPPAVRFQWGPGLDFTGTVKQSTVTNTMFAPNGMPVRMKVNLQLIGEETKVLLRQKQNPMQSPDYTKERLMPYGDQLWMMAQDEYGDPGMWKVIAKENNILNPRKIDRAARLKVPSVR